MNKTIVSAALLIAGILPNGTLVLADHRFNVEEKVEKLKDKLELTNAQETQLRPILEEKKARMEEISNDAHDEIRALLTDEQRAEFNKMIEEKERKGR